jgi:hypothetical protein
MRELIGGKGTIGLQGCSAEEGPIKRPLTFYFCSVVKVKIKVKIKVEQYHYSPGEVLRIPGD